ncbi:MAG: type IV toxin-antitoxin system AbiEi family antitoxin [Woeseiaceae bacterium]
MLNEADIQLQAEPILESLLKPIPFVKGVEFEWEVTLAAERRADFIASISVGNDEWMLVGEVKKNLQPRYVIDVIRQVNEYCSFISGGRAYPVVVSEYISPRSAEILIAQNISYFDLLGNCRLCFGNIYIEKMGEKSLNSERRGVKSLFGLKSSRMLRLMLSDFMRPWQVKELAAKAELSLGQVSNVRRALLDQQYAMVAEGGGIQLTQPGALLSDWQKSYKKNIVNRPCGFYSLLNSHERIKAIKLAIAESIENKAGIILNGVSAARWHAPFAKSVSERFYADKQGFEILKKNLMLEPVETGPNVIIEEPKDLFVFEEAVECASGIKCTSAIQTYLDLYIAGEREQEAAEHLRNTVIEKIWKGNYKGKINE